MENIIANTPSEISKKELLDRTGISYGQLYRWKRQGLIPEDWFQKRSSYTGQETFLPRERILTRIKSIRSMKDDLTLSEIRERLENELYKEGLRQILLNASDISEDFVDSLELNLDEFALSENGVKAVLVLYSALVKDQIDITKQRELISQTIKTMSVSTQAEKG